jgi:hypothetical protein
MFGNLSIRSKLLALLTVPVAGSVLLGVAGVTDAWDDRARAGQERRAAVVAGQVVAAVHELQEERVRAVAWAAGEGGQGELGARRRRVDAALAAYRAGALRRLERTVAGDLDAAALGSLRQRERRLRDRQVLAGMAVLATLVAASLLLRGLGRREMLARAAPGAAVPGLARRGQALADASSSCSRTWSGTSPTRYAARACSGSTTSPPGCADPPRPCSP